MADTAVHCVLSVRFRSPSAYQLVVSDMDTIAFTWISLSSTSSKQGWFGGSSTSGNSQVLIFWLRKSEHYNCFRFPPLTIVLGSFHFPPRLPLPIHAYLAVFLFCVATVFYLLAGQLFNVFFIEDLKKVPVFKKLHIIKRLFLKLHYIFQALLEFHITPALVVSA